MEFLKKYATRRNLFYLTLAAGVLSVITLLFSLYTFVSSQNPSTDSLTQLSNILSMFGLFTLLSMLEIIGVIAAGVGYWFRYQKLHETTPLAQKSMIIGVIASVGAIVELPYLFICIELTQALSQGSFTALFSIAMRSQNAMYTISQIGGIVESIGIIVLAVLLIMDYRTNPALYAAATQSSIAAAAPAASAAPVAPAAPMSADAAAQNTAAGEGSAEGEAAEPSAESSTPDASVAEPASFVQAQPVKPVEVKNLFASTRSKAILGGIIAVVIVAIGVFVFVSNIKTDYDPMKDLTVEFSGVSSKGHASIVSHMPSLDSKASSDAVNFVSTRIHLEVDPADNLSNGDTVTVRAVYDKEAADKAKVHVVQDEITAEVSGLTEVYNTLDSLPQELVTYVDERNTKLITPENIKMEVYVSGFNDKKPITYGDPQLLGKFFVQGSTKDVTNPSSSIVYVYKTEISGTEMTFLSSKEGEPLTKTVYFMTAFTNLTSDYENSLNSDFNEIRTYDGFDTDAEAITYLENKLYNTRTLQEMS